MKDFSMKTVETGGFEEKSKGSQKAITIFRKLRAMQAKRVSDGIKRVKQRRYGIPVSSTKRGGGNYEGKRQHANLSKPRNAHRRVGTKGGGVQRSS